MGQNTFHCYATLTHIIDKAAVFFLLSLKVMLHLFSGTRTGNGTENKQINKWLPKWPPHQNQIKYLHNLEGLQDHCCDLAQNREVAASSEFLYYLQIQFFYYTIQLILRSPIHKCMAVYKHLVIATKKSKPFLNICWTLG